MKIKLFSLALAAFLFTACGNAEEAPVETTPETPVETDDGDNNVENINDALNQLGGLLEQADDLVDLSGTCPELDDWEGLVDDYVLVLKELTEKGEEDAELMAKKLELEERADAFAKDWEEKSRTIDAQCAARMAQIQLKFSAAASDVILGSEGFQQLMENSAELEEMVKAIEEGTSN